LTPPTPAPRHGGNKTKGGRRLIRLLERIKEWAALHRWHGVVSQVLHEHAASLSAASHANRSRRLTKCAKHSGHYRGHKPAEQQDAANRDRKKSLSQAN